MLFERLLCGSPAHRRAVLRHEQDVLFLETFWDQCPGGCLGDRPATVEAGNAPWKTQRLPAP
jgi:hypothetical protein